MKSLLKKLFIFLAVVLTPCFFISAQEENPPIEEVVTQENATVEESSITETEEAPPVVEQVLITQVKETQPTQQVTPNPQVQQAQQKAKPLAKQRKTKRVFGRKKAVQKPRKRKKKKKAKNKKKKPTQKKPRDVIAAPAEGTQTSKFYQERQERFQQIRQQLLQKKKSLFKTPRRRPAKAIKKGPQPVRKKATPGAGPRTVRYTFTKPDVKKMTPAEQAGKAMTATQMIRQRRAAFQKRQKALAKKKKAPIKKAQKAFKQKLAQQKRKHFKQVKPKTVTLPKKVKKKSPKKKAQPKPTPVQKPIQQTE